MHNANRCNESQNIGALLKLEARTILRDLCVPGANRSSKAKLRPGATPDPGVAISAKLTVPIGTISDQLSLVCALKCRFVVVGTCRAEMADNGAQGKTASRSTCRVCARLARLRRGLLSRGHPSAAVPACWPIRVSVAAA